MHQKFGRVLTFATCLITVCFSLSTLFFNLDLYTTYTYIVMVYLVIALVIWMEKENLQHFALDRLSLVILVASTIFRRRLGVENEWYALFMIAAAGGVMFLVGIRYWSKVPKTSLKWLIIGVAAAFVTLIPIIVIEASQWQQETNAAAEPFGVFWNLIRRAIFELSFTAPIEEVLFRSFLWGYLINLKWSDKKVFWTQGILFWCSHIGRIQSPITFLISIPIMTYALSALRKHSGQTAPSVVAHLVINTVVSTIL